MRACQPTLCRPKRVGPVTRGERDRVSTWDSLHGTLGTMLCSGCCLVGLGRTEVDVRVRVCVCYEGVKGVHVVCVWEECVVVVVGEVGVRL
jgi:hypothetical protein